MHSKPSSAKIDAVNTAHSLAALRVALSDYDEPKALVDDMIYAGYMTIVSAPDKAGKSTLFGHLMAAQSRGETFAGTAPDGPGSSIVVSLEEPLTHAVRRFDDLACDPERVSIVHLADECILERLHDRISRSGARLVVIDSLTAVALAIHGVVPSDGDNAGWAGTIRGISRLAHSTAAAVVVIHHARRTDGRYRGASEIAAAADILAEMSVPDSSSTRRRFAVRGRLGLSEFDLIKTGAHYYRAAVNGQPQVPIRDQILHAITADTGVSKSHLAREVPSRRQVVLLEIDRLISEGEALLKGDGLVYRAAPQLHLVT